MSEATVRANSKVSVALRSLSPPQRLEFTELAQHAPAADLQTWLAEHGHQMEFRAVEYWLKSSQKHTKRSLALGKRLKTYRRIDPHDAMIFAMGSAGERLIAMSDELDSEKEVSEDRRSELESKIPALIRELRNAASSVKEGNYIRSRDELQRVGAEIVASELMLTFKDTAFEEPLKEALRGAFAKIEGR